MKATFELPDELVREIKLRAVNERRRVKDVVADAIRRGLDADPDGGGDVLRRVSLPLIESGPAAPEVEVTPARAAEILLADDASAAAP